GGKGASEWNFLPTELTASGYKLSFSGATVSMRFDNDFNDVSGHGAFKALNLVREDGERSLALRDVRVETDSKTRADESIRQQSSFTFGQALVDEKSEASVKLDKV